MKVKRRFDSISSAVEYSRKHADKRATSHTGGYDFSQTDSFDEACDMALNGWSDIREQVEIATEKVRAEVMEQTYTSYEPTWDTTGSVVDVEAFNNGDPECMIEFVPEPKTSDLPVVTILVHADFSGSFSATKIIERGTAICGLVEVLMSLGFGIEVYAETSSAKDASSWSTLVKVKGVDDYTDIESFAFAIGHPAWLRRVVFGIMEGEDAATRRTFGFGTPYGSGYGRPGDSQWKEDINATVVVKGVLAGRDGRNILKPSDWIRDTLEGLGVKVDSPKSVEGSA